MQSVAGRLQAHGCCFRYGYGPHEIPCCLQVPDCSTIGGLVRPPGCQVNKGLTKEKCQAQRRGTDGKTMGWSSSCPKSSLEAHELLKVRNEHGTIWNMSLKTFENQEIS